MTAVEPQATVEITVDGAAVQARPGEMLIEACERSGTYIPRFCYHSRMSPVGMCRMCLVEVDTGRGFALQPSCMVPVSEGMEVSTESELTKKAQDGVLEFLLVNHPLDCPVCDKGGECPLQDQTMAYGPGETRFVEEKRHFAKPVAISETVYLDRERCILCDRCTRFADEVAGDPLIHFMGRGNHTEVNTFPDEPFASYFSGNTVQICPVGALTAAPYRFKARPWDLSETLSTAWVDSVGARVAVQASRNRVLRVLGTDADAVNWGWLTDKERFGFEALNSAERLAAPMLRDPAGSRAPEWREAGWGEALDRLADAVGAAPPERVAVLGGARLTNEAQYMWAKLAKGVIGTDNVDAQLGDGLDPAVVLGLPRAAIDDACRPGGTVVLVGPDPKEELGALYLRLRHAVVYDGVKLVEVTPCETGLSHLAKYSLHPRPGTTAQLIRALVLATDPEIVEAAESDVILDKFAAGEKLLEAEELRELLDPAVLRPGRLDIKIKIDRPNMDGAKDIFRIYLTPELPFANVELEKFDGDLHKVSANLIDQAVDEMYATTEDNRFIEVTYTRGERETLFFKDFVSGAMIKNIVSRAKKTAIKRLISSEGKEKGLSLEDLKSAIREEYRENEDLPNTTNPDDWAKISGRKGEKIVNIRALINEPESRNKPDVRVSKGGTYL